MIKCPHCDQTFKWAHIRDEHVKNKHDPSNKCACGATYAKKCQFERHQEECILCPAGGANAVKRKFAEISQGEEGLADATGLALKAFDMVREEARKKSELRLNGVSYKNKESLKRQLRKLNARASGSGDAAA